MLCISEDQVKLRLFGTIYAVTFSLLAGATFGFGLAVMLDLQIEDRTMLGVMMLMFCFFVLSMLLFGLYIFNKATLREDTF